MLILISDISCPGGETPCNGNGQCNLSSGLCICDDEHQGSDCSGKLILAIFFNYIPSYEWWWILPKMLILISDISCPGGETPCNGYGQCNLKSGLCTCDDDHQGSDCSGKLILAIMMNFAICLN